MVEIIRNSGDIFVIRDTYKIQQYCVMIKTSTNFSQQISPWYYRKGWAIRFYNKVLKERTNRILNKEWTTL